MLYQTSSFFFSFSLRTRVIEEEPGYAFFPVVPILPTDQRQQCVRVSRELSTLYMCVLEVETEFDTGMYKPSRLYDSAD